MTAGRKSSSPSLTTLEGVDETGLVQIILHSDATQSMQEWMNDVSCERDVQSEQ